MVTKASCLRVVLLVESGTLSVVGCKGPDNMNFCSIDQGCKGSGNPSAAKGIVTDDCRCYSAKKGGTSKSGRDNCNRCIDC